MPTILRDTLVEAKTVRKLLKLELWSRCQVRLPVSDRLRMRARTRSKCVPKVACAFQFVMWHSNCSKFWRRTVGTKRVVQQHSILSCDFCGACISHSYSICARMQGLVAIVARSAIKSWNVPENRTADGAQPRIWALVPDPFLPRGWGLGTCNSCMM